MCSNWLYNGLRIFPSWELILGDKLGIRRYEREIEKLIEIHLDRFLLAWGLKLQKNSNLVEFLDIEEK